MKSEKGVTLLSVTVYVIGMTVAIAIISRLTAFFYSNTTDIRDIEPVTEYTTFNTHFSEEANTPNIKILECESDYIAFDNGVQYTFVSENHSVYKNKVKICNNIEKCTFEQGTDENDKTTVKVTIKVTDDKITNRAPIVYTLK